MEIKDIIAKLRDGKELTEDEKKALAAFDPDKAKNDAAAAARKEAEAKAKTLSDELEKLKAENDATKKKVADKDAEKLTETEKLAKQITDLSKGLEAMKADKDKSDKALAAATRKAGISAIREANKLRFLDGVDPDLVNGAFAAALDGVEDLNDKAQVSERVKSFVERNKALIVDNSGSGSGNDFQPANPTSTTLAQTDDQRVAELEKSGKL